MRWVAYLSPVNVAVFFSVSLHMMLLQNRQMDFQKILNPRIYKRIQKVTTPYVLCDAHPQVNMLLITTRDSLSFAKYSVILQKTYTRIQYTTKVYVLSG